MLESTLYVKFSKLKLFTKKMPLATELKLAVNLCEHETIRIFHLFMDLYERVIIGDKFDNGRKYDSEVRTKEKEKEILDGKRCNRK